MGMSYSIGKADVERARAAAQVMLDASDGTLIEFGGGDMWQIDASQTLAIGCGMLSALDGIMSDDEAGVIASKALRTFVELADMRERLTRNE